MIYILKKQISIDQKPEELISKLKWKIQIGKNPYFIQTTRLRSSTNRPFVGKIDELEKTFYLKRIRSYWHYLLPIFLIRGKFVEQGDKTTLEMEYQLGFFTTLFIMYLMLGFYISVRGMILSGFQLDILWWLIVPAIYYVFAKTELGFINEKLNQILEIE